MKTYSMSHVTDDVLLGNLTTLVARDRGTTAQMLAHLAEVDARKLYLPAAHSSMFAFCVSELHLSECSAFKRIRAARAAQEFPAIFDAVADGRLHLSAVVMLKPFLRCENVEELLAAATHKSKAEIELLLAQRFPQGDLRTRVRALPSPTTGREEVAPGPLALPNAKHGLDSAEPANELLTAGQEPERVESGAPARAETAADLPVPARVEPTSARALVKPLSPRRFGLQLTMSQDMHDRLRHAQALLGHQIPSGDVVEVLDRALRSLIRELEKRKIGATDKPRPRQRRATAGGRYVPPEVKRLVWKRDGGRCTFVSETGQRCPAQSRLEFDHIEPVARGGRAIVDGMRLRCRAHNQYEAERVFGAQFMEDKCRDARAARFTSRKLNERSIATCGRALVREPLAVGVVEASKRGNACVSFLPHARVTSALV